METGLGVRKAGKGFKEKGFHNHTECRINKKRVPARPKPALRRGLKDVQGLSKFGSWGVTVVLQVKLVMCLVCF